ncbi:LodA/GoxA family CTQ-dependent oxidase [Marinobacterium sedimentorum]|uniref:LodA/GoxA family CTQ-dependent oxidase n=1 Tax=Marinobacterium sedimentorum TaxID=2927804 RepID=UPI0020C603F6|nr:LodA/GoxA family CTQ-dependent oxidase [Marinobacterium sedimentorum]MCP8688593.1 LodA/GoxA family CTQ-dependent oxidase [Marinobacterium sedimentorum]
MSNSIFRIHPAINFGRVGNSDDFYLAPETAAGEVLDKTSGLFGGLPIQPGTEDRPIDAQALRDASQNVVRQAARYRIFTYSAEQHSYPSEDPGREIKVGDCIDGKTVTDIVWTVHLANKKNNNFKITSGNGQEEGIEAYQDNATPPLRNPSYGNSLGDATRRTRLVIDAGPRAIRATDSAQRVIAFSADSPCSYSDANGAIQPLPDYPVSFPGDHFQNLNPELGCIKSLGDLRIEAGTGRLIVAGGFGEAFSFVDADGKKPTLENAIDNDGWFDDVADGPVDAMILFDDGSAVSATGAWFVSTDPAYAPQTRNVVSTWDDVFSTWVEELALIPSLFSNGEYNPDYQASFNQDILPVFHGAFLQRWNTNLPAQGVQGHNWVAAIKPSDDPKAKIPNFQSLIRDPNASEEDSQGVKMPLALGDAQKSFLSLTRTQYFLMMQWYNGKSLESGAPLGAGEKLDRVVLENCLGGRYSPGIDLTFIVRDINLYQQPWQGVTGPLRINRKPLNYAATTRSQPFLDVGYVPLRSTPVEPGDLSKFMSQPWHTDYNSCAVHTPDPNPSANNTLYWSWPAQRPVQVHPVDACTFDAQRKAWNLGGQVFSIRGDGEGAENLTHTNLPQNEGRYQRYIDFMHNWHKTGFIIQGSQIADGQGGDYGSDKFLEVASLYSANGDIVQPWPTSVTPTKSDA